MSLIRSSRNLGIALVFASCANVWAETTPNAVLLEEWEGAIARSRAQLSKLDEIELPEDALPSDADNFKKAVAAIKHRVMLASVQFEHIGTLLRKEVQLRKARDGDVELVKARKLYKETLLELNGHYVMAMATLSYGTDFTEYPLVEEVFELVGVKMNTHNVARTIEELRGAVQNRFGRQGTGLPTTSCARAAAGSSVTADSVARCQAAFEALGRGYAAYIDSLNQDYEFGVVDNRVIVYLDPAAKLAHYKVGEKMRKWLGENRERSLWVGGLVGLFHGTVWTFAQLYNGASVVVGVLSPEVANVDLQIYKF